MFASACKNHDCGDNNTVLLYSAAQGVVYGKIFQQRRATLIGAPPPAVAAELDRLWLAEWQRTDRRIILFSATRACRSTRPWPGRD